MCLPGECERGDAYIDVSKRTANREGKKKQAKVRELQSIADKLNCTMAQLSIGSDKRKIALIYLNELSKQVRAEIKEASWERIEL